MSTDPRQKIADHWSKLAVSFDGAMASLRSRGVGPETVSAADLHVVDMIHMGGVAATDALASLAGITSGHCVLDVGSGVGGPVRRIASAFGADVYGVELSEVLHQTAVRLTELVGLADRVRLVNGSALSLPFGDDVFNVVIMQHVAMQIADKDLLFGEAIRVVGKGGCLALHEIFAGRGEVHYPLPWATDHDMSALESLCSCTERLARLGLDVGNFVDQSQEGRRYHESSIASYDKALASGSSTLGLSSRALEGRRAASVAMERNLGSGSLRVGMLVANR